MYDMRPRAAVSGGSHSDGVAQAWQAINGSRGETK